MMEVDEPFQPPLSDSKDELISAILSDEPERWRQATIQLKHLVIGSNRQKTTAIESGIVARFLDWMRREEEFPGDLRTEAVIILGSLAFGTESHIQKLISEDTVSVLLRGACSINLVPKVSMDYVGACLRCLRTIFMASCPPVDALYEKPNTIQHLLSIIHQNTCTKETIANILANSCVCKQHQDTLLSLGAIQAMAPLLSKGTMYKIQMPTLKFFAALCYQNSNACMEILRASVENERVVEMIRKLQSRDKTSEMQMAAAKCLTYLYRGGPIIDESRPSGICMEIIYETLHTLVRMCKKDRTLEENVDGAETLAFLIQQEPDLQNIASICDHSIKALAEYLGYTEIQQLDSRQAQKKQVNWENLLKAAAFEAFAAIGANDEEIRKKIIAIDQLVESIVHGMETGDVKVQVAACRCLHSLSRSVQQIRTTLRDHKVWEPLIKMMTSDNGESLKIASSTICNLLLEFSPCKEKIVEGGALEVLAKLCQNQDDPALRLNGVWGLMNMAFNADQRTKMQILELLGSDLLYSLLSEGNQEIVMRTLGLLRNLLSKRNHIDNIMASYGTHALQAVTFILGEGGNPMNVKEQALCVLANICDGATSKAAVLENDKVMQNLLNILRTTNEIELQVASICVVKNLVSGEDEGSATRLQCLRSHDVQPHLQRLAQSPDAHVQERAKSALRHFLS